jgi:hypothetical protein
MMNPTVSYQIAQGRIAELHRQADQSALARTARQPRERRPAIRLPRVAGIAARRVLTAWAAHA